MDRPVPPWDKKNIRNMAAFAVRFRLYQWKENTSLKSFRPKQGGNMKFDLVPRCARKWRFPVLPLLAAAVLAASLALVPGARAATPGSKVYVVTLTGEFGTVDLSTGEFHQIGPNTPESLGSLVWLNGTLYSLSTGGNNYGDLVSINPSTGQVTDIGPTGLGFDAFALGAVNGNLYMTDLNVGGGTQNLYSVDPTTGLATLIGATGVRADVDAPFTIINNSWLVLCDETITGVNGKLYITYDEVSFDLNREDSTYLDEEALIPAALYQVDPSTLATTAGKPTSLNVDAVVQAGGNTYAFAVGIKAFTNKSGPKPATQLLTLDLGSGATTPVENDGVPVTVAAGQGVFGAVLVQP